MVGATVETEVPDPGGGDLGCLRGRRTLGGLDRHPGTGRPAAGGGGPRVAHWQARRGGSEQVDATVHVVVKDARLGTADTPRSRLAGQTKGHVQQAGELPQAWRPHERLVTNPC